MLSSKSIALFIIIGLILGFSGTALAADAGKININTATAEELTQLKGVGEAIAAKIVAYREENGPFSSPEDLMNVKGIGPKILSDNMDMITVGDVAGQVAPNVEETPEAAPPAKK